jgi:phytoene dehydrogenase-like protein
MPRKLATLPPLPVDGWGAFMVYAGIDRLALPAGLPLHHQVIVREPLGEGNTAFISLSPEWDEGRGPQGNRAVTISTHTQLGPWWRLFATDRVAYEERKTAYAEALLSAATRALPSLVARAELMLPGTPVTFQRFTRRTEGWVGGFPQTHLFRAWAPRLADRLWMVGDSIFPGQSTAAVALGGLRVAGSILRAHHSGRTARFLPMRGAALSGSD